jgi:hypothetical protein
MSLPAVSCQAAAQRDELMANLIIVLALLALAHFVYEGIIAPSVRLRLRYSMFELRDELRTLHREDERCSRDAFEIAHNGINQYIDRLHAVNLELMSRFRIAYRDRAFREETERRKAVLDACGSSELRGIVGRANKTIEMAFAANTGMWAVYVAPFIVAAVCVRAISIRVHAYMSRIFATSSARTASLLDEGNYAYA